MEPTEVEQIERINRAVGDAMTKILQDNPDVNVEMLLRALSFQVGLQIPGYFIPSAWKEILIFYKGCMERGFEIGRTTRTDKHDK
jgi:hypothetical protein